MRFAVSALASWMMLLGNPAFADHPIVPVSRDYSDTLSVLLSVPENEIYLTWSKLVIDNLVDPEANIDATLEEIKAFADTVRKSDGGSATADRKVAALRNMIYEAGPWNGFQSFSYDFNDPNGRLASQKTLTRYIDTRKGNCVNMPLFFLAVGEQLGVDMNFTTAPRHIFIQFPNPKTGMVEHLEATSGALPQRLVWQRHVFKMTDRSIESGMYMQRLTKRQMVAAMAETLLQKLVEEGDDEERIEIVEIMLEQFPQFDVAILHTITAYQNLIRVHFQEKYATFEEIPVKLLPKFESWASRIDQAEHTLYGYGWRRTKESENIILPKQQ